MSGPIVTRSFQATLPVPQQEAFAWHQRPGAIDRLLPPWERIDVLKRGDGIEMGSCVEFATRLGPVPLRWLAEHTACSPPDYFEDTQLRGPFRIWRHRHRFLHQDNRSSILEDALEYQLPGGRLGAALGKSMVEKKIQRMFSFRHAVTREDLMAHDQYRDRPRLGVGITGSSGLIGSALKSFLSTGGHSITEITRSQNGSASRERFTWNPGCDDQLRMFGEGLDAVVHLGAENIGVKRWTKKQKEELRESRVMRTRSLCEALASLRQPPQVLLAASAIGYYGETEELVCEESAVNGEGFLAQLAADWEEATQPAKAAGIRVVHLRFGVVLSPRGGALAAMLPAFKMGAGGVIGSGKQYWSWISLDDALGAVLHALMHPDLEGPLNVVAPEPVTNRQFTKTLGSVLNRFTPFPLPAAVARLLLGERAEGLLLSSLRVAPNRLEERGYHFRHPQLETALRHCLGRPHQNCL